MRHVSKKSTRSAKTSLRLLFSLSIKLMDRSIFLSSFDFCSAD